MKWQEKPTEPGWHWIWNDKGFQDEPIPVKVRNVAFQVGLFVDFPGCSTALQVSKVYGKWAGPITAPSLEVSDG